MATFLDPFNVLITDDDFLRQTTEARSIVNAPNVAVAMSPTEVELIKGLLRFVADAFVYDDEPDRAEFLSLTETFEMVSEFLMEQESLTMREIAESDARIRDAYIAGAGA